MKPPGSAVTRAEVDRIGLRRNDGRQPLQQVAQCAVQCFDLLGQAQDLRPIHGRVILQTPRREAQPSLRGDSRTLRIVPEGFEGHHHLSDLPTQLPALGKELLHPLPITPPLHQRQPLQMPIGLDDPAPKSRPAVPVEGDAAGVFGRADPQTPLQRLFGPAQRPQDGAGLFGALMHQNPKTLPPTPGRLPHPRHPALHLLLRPEVEVDHGVDEDPEGCRPAPVQSVDETVIDVAVVIEQQSPSA